MRYQSHPGAPILSVNWGFFVAAESAVTLIYTRIRPLSAPSSRRSAWACMVGTTSESRSTVMAMLARHLGTVPSPLGARHGLDLIVRRSNGGAARLGKRRRPVADLQLGVDVVEVLLDGGG
jgi:hypothetical protein